MGFYTFFQEKNNNETLPSVNDGNDDKSLCCSKDIGPLQRVLSLVILVMLYAVFMYGIGAFNSPSVNITKAEAAPGWY